MSKFAIEYVSGCVGGMAGVVVGQPLDTIKVRLQTQRGMYKGIANCYLTILKKEGPKGLFKGMSSPLLGLSFINAIVFGVEAQTRHYFGSSGAVSCFLSGSTAGLVQSIVCCPMELVKTQMQVQGIGKKSVKRTMKYKTSLDALIQIYRHEGIRGCYRGMLATVIRDTPAFGTYFMTYEVLTNTVLEINKEGNYQASDIMKMLLSGGISGMASWMITYPVDVVKSRIQADHKRDGQYKYRGLVSASMTMYRNEGLSSFVIGLNSSLLRAFPVNAATFAVVQVTAQYLYNFSNQEYVKR